MKYALKFTMFLAFLAFVASCDDDDDTSDIPGLDEETVYQLESVSEDGISAEVTFIRLDEASTEVRIELFDEPERAEPYPVYILMNTAAEGGDIVLSLGEVSGTAGESAITITETSDGTPITYEDFISYDGHINVYESPGNLDSVIAQGDIGGNELTGESTEYVLNTLDVEGISGTATFYERANGEALATIMLEGTPEGGIHPAHIHMNSAAEGGDIAFTFTPVDGTTGMSTTHVAALDDSTAFGYEDVLEYNGYINVHLSAEELSTIVAQGDIGSNVEE
ncbi:hypothetical protein [Algivirga pacifica]|uniref:CHRD domain-containing protein n=1 Tax=Algivirga pacifica TaxID=1162670 RepID=A0ABP9D7F1_9BACT